MKDVCKNITTDIRHRKNQKMAYFIPELSLATHVLDKSSYYFKRANAVCRSHVYTRFDF